MKRGFTIIEMMITLSILGLLSFLTVSGYNSWQRNIRLNTSFDEFKSAIAKAQQLATASADSLDWGVHLNPDQYIIFKDSYSTSSPDNLVYNLNGVGILDSSTSLSDGSGGSSNDLIFSKFTGLTNNTGTINLYLLTDPTRTKSLEIKETGVIN